MEAAHNTPYVWYLWFPAQSDCFLWAGYVSKQCSFVWRTQVRSEYATSDTGAAQRC